MMAKTYKETDKIAYAALEKVLAPLTVAGRTASASFLVWFLQTIYRLEQVEAEDHCCPKQAWIKLTIVETEPLIGRTHSFSR